MVDNSIRFIRRVPAEYLIEAGFLQKLNRIFLGDNTTRVFSAGSYEFGFCEPCTKHIFIGFEKCKKAYPDDYHKFFVMMKGVDFHELSHLLFTTVGVKLAKLNDVLKEVNILEDQRIENMFLHKYPLSAKYFRTLFLKLIESKVEQPTTIVYTAELKEKELAATFVITWGRRFFIDAKVVDTLEQRCIQQFGKELTEQIKKVIDEYLPTTEASKQIEIAIKLRELLRQMIPPPPTSSTYSLGYIKHKSLTKKEGEQIAKEIKEQLGKDYKQEEDDEEDDEDDDDNDDDKKKIDSKKSKKQDIAEQVTQGIAKSLAEAKQDLKKDFQSLKKKFQQRQEDDKSVLQQGTELGQLQVLSIEVQHELIAKKITDIFKICRNDLKQQHVLNQKRGRLNMRAVMRSLMTRDTKVFRKFKADKLDKTKMAVAVLIDSSQSVNGLKWDLEASAAFSIAQALENIGSECMVAEFSSYDTFNIIKSFNQKSREAVWQRRYCTSTSVGRAIVEAHKQLLYLRDKRQIKNLMLIVLSDGAMTDNVKVPCQYNSYDVANKLLKGNKEIKSLFISIDNKFEQHINFITFASAFNKTISVQTFEVLPTTLKKVIIQFQREAVERVGGRL